MLPEHSPIPDLIFLTVLICVAVLTGMAAAAWYPWWLAVLVAIVCVSAASIFLNRRIYFWIDGAADLIQRLMRKFRKRGSV